jgi:hypothetical protein
MGISAALWVGLSGGLEIGVGLVTVTQYMTQIQYGTHRQLVIQLVSGSSNVVHR